jgi:hypothetical protein
MDYPDFDDEIAAVAAAQVIRMVDAGAVPGSDGRRPDAVMEGIILGLAMVIEQAPQCRTKRKLRQISGGCGRLLVQRAQQFRAAFEQTGVHPIMHMHEDEAGRGSSRLN